MVFIIDVKVLVRRNRFEALLVGPDAAGKEIVGPSGVALLFHLRPDLPADGKDIVDPRLEQVFQFQHLPGLPVQGQVPVVVYGSARVDGDAEAKCQQGIVVPDHLIGGVLRRISLVFPGGILAEVFLHLLDQFLRLFLQRPRSRRITIQHRDLHGHA